MRLETSAMSSCPSNTTEPRRIGRIPRIAFKVGVWPAPLRPSKVTTSPSPTSKLMPCRICDSPYQAWRSRTRSISLRWPAASGMSGTHIGLAHLGVLRHFGVIPFGEHAAARQHGDDIGEIGDDREVVLDHQHGAAFGDLAD